VLMGVKILLGLCSTWIYQSKSSRNLVRMSILK
jgi:hypothetical protein